MYTIIKNVIESGRFELNDILTKIDTIWVQGDLTDEQKADLVELAQTKADPINSYAPLQDQIDKLATELASVKTQSQTNADKITAIKAKLEEQGTEIPDPEPSEPEDEYPPYVDPTGAHDAYYYGDKVTYNGKKYVCTAPQGTACVWNPDTYPACWQLVD